MENRIGMIIKHYRKSRGLTQTELAELVGYKDKTSISKIEKGVASITIEQSKKIADVLGFSPIIFLCESSKDIEEFLPYLADADESTRNMIRKMLDMPAKKISSESTKRAN